jgi:hypothetical protein
MNARRPLVALALAWCSIAFAQDGSDRPAVSVRVLPAGAVEPGSKVTIEGVAPIDGAGDVTLRITRPGGETINERVLPSTNGDYSLAFSATDAAGTYRIAATSPGGGMRGSGTFEVAVQEPLDDIDEAHAEADRVAAAIDEVIGDLDGSIALLPESPERDRFIARWAEAKPQLQQAKKELADTRKLTQPFTDAVRADPTLKPALKPIARALENWQTRSVAERARILAELAQSRRDGVTCEKLERISEGFNFASALFNLAGGPFAAVKAVAGDYLASAASALAGRLSANFGFAAGEATKIAAAVGDARAKNVFELEKFSVRAAAKDAVRGNAAGLLSDLYSFLASSQFSKYCERLAGRFTGGMHAEFIANGITWWAYTIEFEGRVDLRYAKGTIYGQAAAIKGDILGQATKFTFKEDAIRGLFPTLVKGAVMYKRTVLPQPQVMNLLTGQLTEASGQLREEKPIEIEGKAAAVFVKPYSFFVPVEGEIVDGVLSLRRQPATRDYEAVARVVYVIVSPLAASLGPQLTSFELPYKGGGFFIERAFGDDGIRAAVRKTPKGLMVDDSFRHEKGTNAAKGSYRLSLKLCNPEGSC